MIGLHLAVDVHVYSPQYTKHCTMSLAHIELQIKLCGHARLAETPRQLSPLSRFGTASFFRRTEILSVPNTSRTATARLATTGRLTPPCGRRFVYL